jgi:hypothetical protein
MGKSELVEVVNWGIRRLVDWGSGGRKSKHAVRRVCFFRPTPVFKSFEKQKRGMKGAASIAPGGFFKPQNVKFSNRKTAKQENRKM